MEEKIHVGALYKACKGYTNPRYVYVLQKKEVQIKNLGRNDEINPLYDVIELWEELDNVRTVYGIEDFKQRYELYEI